MMQHKQPNILRQFGIVIKTEQQSKPIHEEPMSMLRPHAQTLAHAHTPMDVFLDGSCIGNGSKHAKGGYAGVFPAQPALNFSEALRSKPATNNKAEYMALIRAHEIAPTRTPLVVYTDSMLLYKTFTQWLPGWKRRGWKKADGSPVLNLDLVQRIDAIKNERFITMKHVRAHTGGTDYESVNNDLADQLAKSAASSQK
jgi:ribonuclease HI